MHASASSRRHFLATSAFGLSSVALACLLDQDGLLASPPKPDLVKPTYDLLPKTPPAPPRAKAMISLFMQGGPSQMDLVDPKPELTKRNGEKFPGDIKYDNAAQASAKIFGSPWKFEHAGQCGMEISELLPGLREVADDITLIRSMQSGVNNHGQAIYAMNSGRTFAGRPALGSWLTYGLGTENQNLPAFVVLTDPDGLPVLGVDNWANGWLPSLYQGTAVRAREPRIPNLDVAPYLRGEAQENYLGFLTQLHTEPLARHARATDLE